MEDEDIFSLTSISGSQPERICFNRKHISLVEPLPGNHSRITLVCGKEISVAEPIGIASIFFELGNRAWYHTGVNDHYARLERKRDRNLTGGGVDLRGIYGKGVN